MENDPKNPPHDKTELLSQLRAQVETVIQHYPSHQNTDHTRPKCPENLDNWDQYTYIKQARRAIRTNDLKKAKSLLLQALDGFPGDRFVLLEMSKYLEHQEKDYKGALEYALQTPEEAEGKSAHDKRVARLQGKV